MMRKLIVQPNRTMRGRKRGSLALRWVVTIGLLTLVATQVDFEQLGSIFENIRWGWVALAAMVAFGDRVVATVRWWTLLRVKNIDIGFIPLFNLHMAANFVGGFLPTSFGADAARIVILSRRTGKTMDTVAASATDRLIMIATTVTMAIIMSGVFVGAYFPSVVRWAVVTIGGLCLVVCLSIVILGRKGVFDGMIRVALGERIAGKLATLYMSVCEYRHRPSVLLHSAGISAVMLIFRAALLVLMAGALGLDLSLSTALVLWPIVGVILMLPVSLGNFGLQEGTYVALLGMIGVPVTLAVSISMLDHILSRAVVLPGAALWLWGTSPTERLEATTE